MIKRFAMAPAVVAACLFFITGLFIIDGSPEDCDMEGPECCCKIVDDYPEKGEDPYLYQIITVKSCAANNKGECVAMDNC